MWNLDHEYCLLGGLDRTIVGRYLSLAAAFISAALVFILLSIVDLARTLGLPVNVPPTVLSLLSAGVVFSGLYWCFNRFIWRWKLAARFIQVPDLRGDWICEGNSLNDNGKVKFAWQGVVTISQTWGRFRVRLKTDQSTSNSITAALIKDDLDGYRLLFNYRNEPKVGQPQLAAHVGFCDLLFDQAVRAASGDYFTGRGRYNFGTMNLTRKNNVA